MCALHVCTHGPVWWQLLCERIRQWLRLHTIGIFLSLRSRLISETYKYFLCTEEKATFSSTLFDGVAVIFVFFRHSYLSIGTFVRLNIRQIDRKMAIFALK